MRWARKIAPAVVWALCVGWGAWGLGQGSSAAQRVTVRQVDSFGAELAEAAYVYTDEAFTSVEAPARAGYRFTHWAVSPSQPNFANRDAWGRALDAVSVVPKDSVVTLTAVYADAEEDTDGDGIADADERYWYGTPDAYDTEGTLEHDAASDTDGDGYAFADELRYALLPERASTRRRGARGQQHSGLQSERLRGLHGAVGAGGGTLRDLQRLRAAGDGHHDPGVLCAEHLDLRLLDGEWHAPGG